MGAVDLARVTDRSFEILSGSHLDDPSACDDPEQSGEVFIDDPARHSDITTALGSLLTEGSRPPASASVVDVLDAPAAAMEQLHAGRYTVILPDAVRSPRTEHIRISFTKNEDGTISWGNYSFCLVG